MYDESDIESRGLAWFGSVTWLDFAVFVRLGSACDSTRRIFPDLARHLTWLDQISSDSARLKMSIEPNPWSKVIFWSNLEMNKGSVIEKKKHNIGRNFKKLKFFEKHFQTVKNSIFSGSVFHFLLLTCLKVRIAYATCSIFSIL